LINQSIDKRWQDVFLKAVQQHENALPLKEAALQERLGDWTKELTSVVVIYENKRNID